MACDIINLARPGVGALQPYQPGKPVEDLERELGITGAIKLASNENPLGPGSRALAAIARHAAEIGRYPDGNGTVLKRALAQQLGTETDRLTLGNGSNEVLELVARTFAGVGDEIIFARHSFAVYPIVTQAVGATAVITPVTNWISDLDAMRDAVTEHTKIIFIANPNNPTGTLVSESALRSLIESLPDHVLTVIDQAYFEYVDADDYPDCTAWVESYDRLLVTRTFSKIHALAGLRMGYGVSSPAIAELMNRVRQPFNVNSLAMSAALAALDDAEHIQRSIALNNSGMSQLIQGLDALGLGYIPSAGNFICAEVGQAANHLYDELLQRGVIVRPIANYEMPNHLRITIGLEEENARFLDALGELIQA